MRSYQHCRSCCLLTFDLGNGHAGMRIPVFQSTQYAGYVSLFWIPGIASGQVLPSVAVLTAECGRIHASINKWFSPPLLDPEFWSGYPDLDSNQPPYPSKIPNFRHFGRLLRSMIFRWEKLKIPDPWPLSCVKQALFTLTAQSTTVFPRHLAFIGKLYFFSGPYPNAYHMIRLPENWRLALRSFNLAVWVSHPPDQTSVWLRCQILTNWGIEGPNWRWCLQIGVSLGLGFPDHHPRSAPGPRRPLGPLGPGTSIPQSTPPSQIPEARIEALNVHFLFLVWVHKCSNLFSCAEELRKERWCDTQGRQEPHLSTEQKVRTENRSLW